MESRPKLYNGFKINTDLFVRQRIEVIFFTEVYLLSDDSYLLLFLNISPNNLPPRANSYNQMVISCMNCEYQGIIISDYSKNKLVKIVKDISAPRGFDCVAGMRELKNILIADVIYPLFHPEKYNKFKVSIPNGILLYGPPGCGKTYIVKKLAEELEYNCVELCPSSVATPYVHGAVSNIGNVFEIARNKAPSIIFIDEIEGLLPKREELSSFADIKKEEINEFLIQLNNASEHKILVVGATNRPHMIDLAILRSGRMDKRVYVGPPDHEAREDLFKICLRERPYDTSINFSRLSEMTNNFASSDIELIVNQSARIAVVSDLELITEKIIADIILGFSPSISVTDIEYYNQFDDLKRL